MPPKTSALEDIFGGSDLSDLEDDLPSRPLGGAGDSDDGGALDSDDEAARQEAAEEAAMLAEEDAREEDDNEGDADYQADAEGRSKLPSFKKRDGPRAPRAEGEERPKKRPKKRPQRPAAEDDDVAPPMPLDPIAERAARLDAILQNKKKKAPRKRKPGEEDLDELADEEVYRLRQSMDAAVEFDKEALTEGRPAIEKIKLLPEVVAVLQKSHLETTILEADILTQIRRWLEPVGKAMPALNIQRALLDALTKLDIETSQLKASELGKIVLFYTKNPKLDSSVKRTADQLVMNWMRPIIRRSAHLRDRQIPRAEPGQARSAGRPRGAATNTPKDKTEIARRHAAIPQAINTAYTVAPISRISADPNMAPKSNARFKSMKSRLDASRQESRKM